MSSIGWRLITCISVPVRTPEERKQHLLPEPNGHLVAHHAVVRRPLPIALNGGAQKVVERREVRGVVLVDSLNVLRVVPVVERQKPL